MVFGKGGGIKAHFLGLGSMSFYEVLGEEWGGRVIPGEST